MLRSLGLVQISVLIIVAVLFMLTWDFGRRILENVQAFRRAQAASAELAQANQVNVQLKTS